LLGVEEEGVGSITNPASIAPVGKTFAVGGKGKKSSKRLDDAERIGGERKSSIPNEPQGNWGKNNKNTTLLLR